MKFALMWANHDRRDQFCPEFGKPRTVWLPSRHSPKDTARMIDYCIEHYFRQPNYWRVNGGLFFSIFEAAKFIEQIGGPEKTKALLTEMDARVRRAGLPPMHWGAMVANPTLGALAHEAGFHSTSRYNVAHAKKTQPDFTERYEDVMEAHREHWKNMATAPIVNMPVVTMGWDSTPRCRADVPWPFAKVEYPYVPVVVGNTPERYEQLLKDAANHVRGSEEAVRYLAQCLERVDRGATCFRRTDRNVPRGDQEDVRSANPPAPRWIRTWKAPRRNREDASPGVRASECRVTRTHPAAPGLPAHRAAGPPAMTHRTATPNSPHPIVPNIVMSIPRRKPLFARVGVFGVVSYHWSHSPAGRDAK